MKTAASNWAANLHILSEQSLWNMQAEHRKFYYRGEHVILTSKAGCSVLEEAHQLLTKQYAGKPVIQTYYAVGDGQRPQHKIILFGQSRIIITGKRSSGMVGQVHELLDAHFNSAEYKTSIQPKGLTSDSKHTSALAPSGEDNDVQQKWSVNQATEDNGWDESGCHTDGVSAVSSKDQRRLELNTLFSKAITELKSGKSYRASGSKSNECVKSSRHVASVPKSRSDIATDFNLVDNSIIEVGNPISMPTVEEDGILHSNFNKKIALNNNHTGIPVLGQCIEVITIDSGSSSADSSTCEEKKLSSPSCSMDDISTSDGSAVLGKAGTNNKPTGGDVITYDREFLLHMSVCKVALIYPHSLIVTSDCEILIKGPNCQKPFDPSAHRLPDAELAMSNVFPNYINHSTSNRRNMAEQREPQYHKKHTPYTSDPRSWGDSNGNTRYRKFMPGPGEVLYSESAYNCMEPAPESATFCTELDAVFKNNAKVTPGITFTKRPKQSLNSEHIRELLEYYEPHSN